MQCRLRDFQAANHATGVFSYQAVGNAREAHELQCRTNGRLSFFARQIIKFGEYEQILVSGEGTVHRDRLGHVANDMADADRLRRDCEASSGDSS